MYYRGGVLMALQFMFTFMIAAAFFAFTAIATGLPPSQEGAFRLSVALVCLSTVGVAISAMLTVWGF